MGSGPTALRLARGSTAALDLDTEAGRALLQERLAFYYKLCFVLSGATLVEVCSHHLRTPSVPPAERLGPPVPASLERLLLSCLEKDPARPREPGGGSGRTFAVALEGRTG